MITRINTIIIDRSHNERVQAKELLKSYSSINVIGCYACINSQEIDQKPSLAIVDMQEDVSGLLDNKAIDVILTTVDYTLIKEALKTKAVDCILKPFRATSLEQSLKPIIKRHIYRESKKAKDLLINRERSNIIKDYAVDIKEILYVDFTDNTCQIVFKTNRELIETTNFADLQSQLEGSNHFAYVSDHKLVNLNEVKRFSKKYGHNLELSNKEKLNITKQYQAPFELLVKSMSN